MPKCVGQSFSAATSNCELEFAQSRLIKTMHFEVHRQLFGMHIRRACGPTATVSRAVSKGPTFSIGFMLMVPSSKTQRDLVSRHNWTSRNALARASLINFIHRKISIATQNREAHTRDTQTDTHASNKVRQLINIAHTVHYCDWQTLHNKLFSKLHFS